ncbi:hypothetical protein RDI58_026963 [Solanum bulbocastanum]|uniref:RCD1 WWE domain-containing protein n=1 Tax=Solanum bulbocastanum TaxID=147425 RepID=A0AAN8Y1X9_SOLBU
MAKKDLRIKRSAMEVVFSRNNYMLDFFKMMLLDLKSGMHQPIAWINEAGKCFFLEVLAYCDELHGFLLSYAGLPSSKGRITSIMKYRLAILIHLAPTPVTSLVFIFSLLFVVRSGKWR